MRPPSVTANQSNSAEVTTHQAIRVAASVGIIAKGRDMDKHCYMAYDETILMYGEGDRYE